MPPLPAAVIDMGTDLQSNDLYGSSSPLEQYIRSCLSEFSFDEDPRTALDYLTWDWGQYEKSRRSRNRNRGRLGRTYNPTDTISEYATLTQVLIDSTKPSIYRWLTNEALLDIDDDEDMAEELLAFREQTADAPPEVMSIIGPMLDEAEQAPTMEEDLREILPDELQQDLTTDFLLFGIAGTLVNAVIRPTLIDPTVTLTKPRDKFIVTEITITNAEMDILQRMFSGDAAEQDMPAVFSLTQTEEEVVIRYGNLEYEGQKFRFFIDPTDSLFIQEIPRFDLNYVVWDRDVLTQEPIGVFGKIRSLEPKHRQRQEKLNKFIHNALEASMFIQKDMLPADKREIYKDAIVEVEGGTADGDASISDRVYEVPNKLELVELLRSELALLEQQARQLTGLVEVNNFSPDQTRRTATEASIEFYRSTTQIKNIIDKLALLQKETYLTAAQELFGRKISITLRKNPIDLEQEVEAAHILFDKLITVYQLDPEGLKLGGAVDAKAISECLKILSKSAGLKPEVFALNFQTASMNAELAAEAQVKAEEAELAALAVTGQQTRAQLNVSLAELAKARTQAEKASNEAVLDQQQHYLKERELRAQILKDRALAILQLLKDRPEVQPEQARTLLDSLYEEADNNVPSNPLEDLPRPLPANPPAT